MSGPELQQWLALATRPLLGPLCQLWPAFRDRVLGNPRFLLVLAVEEVIGCTAKTIAEYQLRKEKFWKVAERPSMSVSHCLRAPRRHSAGLQGFILPSAEMEITGG
jgi:hypothetical protein